MVYALENPYHNEKNVMNKKEYLFHVCYIQNEFPTVNLVD